VDHRAGLDAVAMRKIPWPSRESNPGLPARGIVTPLIREGVTVDCEDMKWIGLSSMIFRVPILG